MQLEEVVNQGNLVSDEVIINLLSKRLEASSAKGETGFILDGFPRTIRQAVNFDTILIKHVAFTCYLFSILCVHESITECIVGCLKSKGVRYHLEYVIYDKALSEWCCHFLS